MRVVPHAFYQQSAVHKVMVDGLSCVIEKTVDRVDTNNERYLAAHALTLVQNGRLMVETPDHSVQWVEAGQFVFLPRGVYMITDILPQDEPFSAVVFFFSEALLGDFLRDHSPLGFSSNEGGVSSLLVADQAPQLQLFTSSLLQLYGQPNAKNTPQLARQKLLELLHILYHGALAKQFRARLHRLSQREKVGLKQFMLTHFSKPLGVADFAYLSGRSISTFQRDFKRLFGVSPKEWLTQQRLAQAKAAFDKGATKVGQVGLSVGYDNLSHFIKVFRRAFGITPKQYCIQRRNLVKL